MKPQYERINHRFAGITLTFHIFFFCAFFHDLRFAWFWLLLTPRWKQHFVIRKKSKWDLNLEYTLFPNLEIVSFSSQLKCFLWQFIYDMEMWLRKCICVIIYLIFVSFSKHFQASPKARWKSINNLDVSFGVEPLLGKRVVPRPFTCYQCRAIILRLGL